MPLMPLRGTRSLMLATVAIPITFSDYVDGDELEFHLTARQAAAYAAEAGVDRLVLTHLEPGVDPATSLAQAREVFEGEITVASPGLRFDI